MREDSANANAYHTFESAERQQLHSAFLPAHRRMQRKYRLRSSARDSRLVRKAKRKCIMGDSLGGVSIRRGFQFLNGGSNALTFGGSFSTSRTQNFQDANGTIALTNQLPLERDHWQHRR